MYVIVTKWNYDGIHTYKYTMNYVLDLHWPCFYIQYTYVSIVCTMYI